jgi:pyridoxal phosphate enzyme (YggS family)
LIQVNIAEEDTKFGLAKEEVLGVIEEVSKLSNVKIKGLMTIAPFVDDPEENRVHFQNLHQLFIDIKEKTINNVDMEILSMGMTGDYQVAVEEGATMVRVGTGIFGARNYNI